MEDKRRFYRILINFDVKYAIINKATSKDISQGGICIITDKPLDKEAELTLIFTLPDEVGRRIKTFGRVVWCREIDESNYEAGLEFWDMEDTFVDTIRKFVDKNKHINQEIPVQQNTTAG
ncbi:MAG: PilZ domain-containing protein [Spirochaetales bacterium]|nr:PilZ domain-containing protein [Spirochaetales bacterium]